MSGLCCGSACPSLSHVHWCGRGGVLERGVWRVGSGREQLLAVKTRSEGAGIRSQECLWKKPGPPEKQNAIVEWCTRGRATLCPLPCPLPRWALGGASTRAGSHFPPANTSSGLLAPVGLHTLPITASTPTGPRGVSGRGAGGRTTSRGGLNPQLSPWGHAVKEEELDSLVMAARTIDLHHCCWL